MVKRVSPEVAIERKLRPQAGQWNALLLAAAVLLLVSCGDKRPAIGEVGAVEGHIGGVATDEPHAAVVAQDVLSAGGTAVDAAVAAFFALSVTYPVGAGIGGGGVCVVYDATSNEAHSLEFLAGRPAAPGPFAVPGAVRGLAALHARYGRIGWGGLVAPAEKMARFGHSLSRALARQLEQADAAGLLTPEVRRHYARSDGSLKGEGEKQVDFELAGILSRLRARGAGALYGGQAGRLLVDAAQAVGGSLTLDDLRDYRPVWRGTRTLKFGDEVGHVALPPPLGGAVLYDLLQALRPERNRRDEARLLAATESVYAPHGEILASLPGDAVVVAGDRDGGAAACAFTMGTSFGTGRLAQDAGVLMAPVTGREEAFIAPMVVANHNINQGYLAIAASGGRAAPVATALAALSLLQEGADLEAALAAPRAARFAPGGPTIREGEDAASEPSGPKIGNVQAVWCPNGLRRGRSTCAYASDPRGHGLARGRAF